MTTKREDIELLFKDLSARFSFGVKGLVLGSAIDTILTLVNVKNPWLKTSSGYICSLEQFKPYLRPMSSMTYEEKKELEATKKVYSLYDGNSISEYTDKSLDWLLSHHFDFRNLIEKGLALEAPEYMYNTQSESKLEDVVMIKALDQCIEELREVNGWNYVYVDGKDIPLQDIQKWYKQK